MVSTTSRLPRRHRQRQALRHTRSQTPPDPLSRLQQLRINSTQENTADRDWEAADTDLETNDDSGYNSFSNFESRMLEEMEEDFKTAGPTLANHSESTKLCIKMEERKWQL